MVKKIETDILMGANSTHELSNEQKAKIIRAFYDSAERYLQAAKAQGKLPEEQQLEDFDLDALLSEAQSLSSPEFAAKLSQAAEIFFARISGEEISQPDPSADE